MPDPVEPAQLTDKEEAKWRAEFERRGRAEIHAAIYQGQGVYPDRKRELAKRWLREKEIEAENREHDLIWYAKWTWDAAFAAAILAAIGIVVAMLLAR